MKINAIRKSYDLRDGYCIEVDGEEVFEAYDGEPEDSNLSRDFNAIYSIPDLMKRAYEAGKAGETFEIEDTIGDW